MNTLQEHIERLIDAHSLPTVLASIASVCCNKAEHIKCNWQDMQTAKIWAKAAIAADKAKVSATKLGLRY